MASSKNAKANKNTNTNTNTNTNAVPVNINTNPKSTTTTKTMDAVDDSNSTPTSLPPRLSDSPPPISTNPQPQQHTGTSHHSHTPLHHSHHSHAAGCISPSPSGGGGGGGGTISGRQNRILSRRSSVVDARIHTDTIGVPGSDESSDSELGGGGVSGHAHAHGHGHGHGHGGRRGSGGAGFGSGSVYGRRAGSEGDEYEGRLESSSDEEEGVGAGAGAGGEKNGQKDAEGEGEEEGTRPSRPRMHQRSLTGGSSYTDYGATATGTCSTPSHHHHGHHPAWPVGDEATWKQALERDLHTTDTVPGITYAVVHHVTTTLARQAWNVDEEAAYQACALAVRDELVRKWNATTSYLSAEAGKGARAQRASQRSEHEHNHEDREQKKTKAKTVKRVYYLSLEFLMGRTLDNAVLNLGLKDKVQETMGRLGFSFEDMLDCERDAGLGNGGLGRLAACYLDSSATLNIPMWGYGLRYQYGIFRQLLDQNLAQVEAVDPWLDTENPWEITRNDVKYAVRFYGTVDKRGGKGKAVWYGGQEVLAVAYDVPIPGWKTRNVNNIRLWSAKPIAGFDLQSFNAGNYEASVQASQQAENITKVLYPNDSTWQGKELRLKQQYFWVCASLQDILRRFRKLHLPWSYLPDNVAIQLNDTHPALAIPELIRILVDEESLDWDSAWAITSKIFAYTNHTVLPEALETWPVPLMESLLPRHLSIIYDINLFFLQSVAAKFPGDNDRLGRMSLIEESEPKRVRMAFLATVCCFKVNGVAELHSQLIKSTIFKDFVEHFGPDKFTNVTNGIAVRRFAHQSNPELSQLITSCLGNDDWIGDFSKVAQFAKFAEDPQVLKAFQAVKERNKLRLAEIVERELGIELDPTAMFTVQAKRLHEYKRQSLNILGCIYRYIRIKKATPAQRRKITPHVAFFSGKAAPGYYIAKLIIQLINNVARVVNDDDEIGDLLKIVFIPDYSVSVAEVLMPAGDVSVQISTAGTEASGTGNMKLAFGGALLLGTVDGANVEIAEEAGEEQCFLFGYLAQDVEDVRIQNQTQQIPIQERSPECWEAIQTVQSGLFGNANYSPFLDTIIHNDYYLVSNDFGSYLEAERLADELFMKDHQEWNRRSLLTTARMGKFSADRAVQEYADEIWSAEAEPVPDLDELAIDSPAEIAQKVAQGAL